jgi:rfaE bifunctional protein nucleotidyltransferase chain/domain
MESAVFENLLQKVLSASDLTSQIADWKLNNKRVVFTNGCFDLLHAGHIAYLTEAASLGDILIVGLNSDRSVCGLKGPGRPVNTEKTRSMLLASMFFINAVILFDEDTPLTLIKSILPDVLVKGGDYEIKNIVGAEETLQNGGEVKVLSFLPGYSSSAIIQKIKSGQEN